MKKMLRLIGLTLVLSATLPLLSSKPLYACLHTCDVCNTWGCKGVGGDCVICCAKGTPGCIQLF